MAALSNLPENVVVKIVSFLHFEDAHRARLACSVLNDAVCTHHHHHHQGNNEWEWFYLDRLEKALENNNDGNAAAHAAQVLAHVDRLQVEIGVGYRSKAFPEIPHLERLYFKRKADTLKAHSQNNIITTAYQYIIKYGKTLKHVIIQMEEQDFSDLYEGYGCDYNVSRKLTLETLSIRRRSTSSMLQPTTFLISMRENLQYLFQQTIFQDDRWGFMPNLRLLAVNKWFGQKIQNISSTPLKYPKLALLAIRRGPIITELASRFERDLVKTLARLDNIRTELEAITIILDHLDRLPSTKIRTAKDDDADTTSYYYTIGGAGSAVAAVGEGGQLAGRYRLIQNNLAISDHRTYHVDAVYYHYPLRVYVIQLSTNCTLTPCCMVLQRVVTEVLDEMNK